MKRYILSSLIALMAFMGVQAQSSTIHLTTGDSLIFSVVSDFNYQVGLENGKPALIFKKQQGDQWKDILTIKEFKDLEFHTRERDSLDSRKALFELYQALGGDQWNRKAGWCTEKPVSEWEGVDSYQGHVSTLWLNMNNLSGQLPDCFGRISFGYLSAFSNFITGSIPDSWFNNLDMEVLQLQDNQLSGTLSEKIANWPKLRGLRLDNNRFSGPLPEGLILKLLDKNITERVVFSLNGNDFSGTVPSTITSHPKFKDYWTVILPQSGNLDISGITIPAMTDEFKDINGTSINLGDIYKSHKYTLVYNWGHWCNWSALFNEQLIPAYNALKEKGFEVVAFNSDEDEALPAFVKGHNIPWINIPGAPVGMSPGWFGYKGAFPGVFGVPNAMLVDENGHVVYSTLMDEQGNNKVGDLEHRNKFFSILEDLMGKVEYNFYTSTDYSKDGEVTTMQQATVGNGVDLVFVGNGFVDKDMAEGGKYEQKMQEAMEQFFAFEPYKSLRNRFNVYAVKAVSPNAETFGGGVQAIKSDADAFTYAQKVTTLIPNRPMYVNVIYGAQNASNGRSYCRMYEDNSYVAWNFVDIGMVLNHEAGGHGVGRLLDEYIEPGNENLSLPDEKKTEADAVWASNGRGANIDWRSDPTQVKWSHFINDERYAAEGIGVYEGSWLYGHGAYRPTLNSMMRYNDYPFNAPSREAIYKNVMQESEGDSWIYDYETFVAFDEAGRAEFVNALNSSARQQAPRRGMKQQEQHLTAPPVFVKGTWRDVLNKKKYHNKK